MDRRFGFGIFLLVVLAAVVVGMLSFDAGVSHALALNPAVNSGGAVAAVPPYYWHRGWGWGFGFGPIFVLLFWFMIFGVFRGLFWGGGYRRRWYPRDLEGWHRRMHEEMDKKA
jgi:hypothetical protein